jgi:hypothetical protein
VALIAGVAAAATADSDALRQGRAIFTRGDDVRAARFLAPMARTETHAPWRCSASYENGFGVPQSYHAAVSSTSAPPNAAIPPVSISWA